LRIAPPTRKRPLTRRIAARFGATRRSGSPVPPAHSRFRALLAKTWAGIRFCVGNRYFAFLVLILALTQVLNRTSRLAAIYAHPRIELPLLLALFWTLNFVLRPGKLAPFIAAFPIAVFYVGYDVFYVAWGNIFKVIDAQNLPLLLKVLPLAARTGLLIVLLLPVVLVICFVDYRKYRRWQAALGVAVLFVVTLELWPGVILSALDRAGFQVPVWSNAEMTNENGRLTTTLYYEGMRRQALADTAMYRERSDYDTQVNAAADFIRKHGNHRNVHLVVLESFVDPTLFSGVTFTRDPRHPDFAKLVGDQQSFSISPVFGGETAQAEFEALCGVPALQKLSEIEFNEFTGESAGCMPGILAKAGYSTTVSNAFEPNYFNSTKAYTGIGFQNIYFPAEYGSANATYLTARNVSPDESYVFDGDLFEQNLAFVSRTLHDNPGRPILNYVLGIYGHEPHDIDTERRPLVVSVNSTPADEQLMRASNQYWYRTQAIAHYVQALTKLDPTGLIVIVSDHLPPLGKGVKSYEEFRYLNNAENSTHLNRILIVENGKVVRHRTIHHYEIPSLVYQYVSGKEFCAKADCVASQAELAERYMSLMARAVGRQTTSEVKSPKP